MATLREVKRRIVNVSNVQRITQSLKAVATSRLSVIKNIKNNESFFNNNALAFNSLLWLHKQKGNATSNLYNVAFNNTSNGQASVGQAENSKKIVVVFSSNRGLCGAYNNNVINKATKFINKINGNCSILTFGEKANYFLKKDFPKSMLDITYSAEIKDVSYDDFIISATAIVDMLTNNKADGVSVVYTHSYSVISQEVKIIDLLPISFSTQQEATFIEQNTVTDEAQFTDTLQQLMVNYLAYKLYICYINSLLAEFSSRLTAMDNAYENCKELKTKLSLIHNRTRQALVTKELSEIVAGVEAS